jgi:hypothetical protein
MYDERLPGSGRMNVIAIALPVSYNWYRMYCGILS